MIDYWKNEDKVVFTRKLYFIHLSLKYKMKRTRAKWSARITCRSQWANLVFLGLVFQDLWNTNIFYFLPMPEIWAAIRSKSLRPWEVNLRPPLGSFSTSLSCSKDCKALRAMVPDPALQWLGALPLLRRTKRKCKWGEMPILISKKNRNQFGIHLAYFCHPISTSNHFIGCDMG